MRRSAGRIAQVALSILLMGGVSASAQIGGNGIHSGHRARHEQGRAARRHGHRHERRHRNRDCQSNDEAGVYTLAPLPPGEYRVTVALDGFETFAREGVIVDGAGRRRPQRHAAGRRSQTGGARHRRLRSPLSTADARLGQTIRNEVYTALPLVMNTGGPRDPTAFMFLMPGVQSIGRWGNVMGGQDFTTDMYVEGIPITNAVVQGEGRNLSFGFSVEAVEQFQVETSGTAVTFSGQGASNYVVKSGTNTFRGSGFEFFRHKSLDAKAFFATTKPDDNQHEYGVTAGGPIRRNQMFFFAAYDGYRDRRQTASVLTSIPTLAATQWRLQRIAGADLRSANDPAEPERDGIRARPVSQQHHSVRSHFADLALLPVVPAGSDQRRAAEQLSRRVPAGRLQQPELHWQARPQAEREAAGVGARSRTASAARRRRIVAARALPRRCRCPTRKRGWSKRSRRPRRSSTRTCSARGGSIRPAWDSPGCRSRSSTRPSKASIRSTRACAGCPPAKRIRRSRRLRSPGPNAPTQWRGTDARAFTEYLNNYTLQNNLNWTFGKHAMTFGLQAQRMDANERERAYGSLATFGFSNVQTAGFNAGRHAADDDGQCVCELSAR